MKKFILILFFIIPLIGCNKKQAAMSVEKTDEFSSLFYTALTTDNNEVIESAIIQIDNLINSGEGTGILSIYYNKAQLLYKLGKYEEAIKTINKNDDGQFDLQEAALYVRLGYEDKATALLKKLYNDYKEILYVSLENKKERDGIIQILMFIDTLSDQNVDMLIAQLVNEGVLTNIEANNIVNKNIMTKEIILNSMWPS